MITLAAAPELEPPLASASLRKRFPQLSVAMNNDLMLGRLQRLLLDGSGLVAESCPVPKAELGEDTCWIQYPLQVRRPSDGSSEILVLGTMFGHRDAAAVFERVALAPLAARLPHHVQPAPKPTAILESLAMAVSVFPVNDPLPTLVHATDPLRVSAALRAMDAPCTWVVGVELVRFRRTRGCVLRCRLGPHGDAVLYGKVGYAASAENVRDALEALADRLHRGSPAVPRVLGHARDLDLTLMTCVPGSRPDLRVAAVLDQAVDGAAMAAASIHGSGVATAGVRTLDDAIDRARAAVALIRDDAPALTAWLTSVVDLLDALAARTPEQPRVVAHGDFTPSQLLLAGSQVGILDFDKLCQAEPALDLGRFLAYLRVALTKYGNRSVDAHASRFLETYHALGGQPTLDTRLAVYEAASLVRMAARSWLQLKPARLRLVCGVLEEQVGRW
jgi:hypothetical protein